MKHLEQTSDLRARGDRAVLVVEDDVLTRMVLAEALRLEGLEVLEAASADEALLLLDATHPVEVLVTDIDMPGPMDGLDLAQRVKETLPNLKVLVASAFEPPSPALEHVDAFFQKPYPAYAITHCVLQLLQETDDKPQ